MKKKHIMFITFSLDVGGIETLILEICRRIDRQKYQPFVCSFYEKGRLAKEFESLDIPVLTVPKLTESIDWTLPFRLAKQFRDLDIDIVHTHNPSVWLYGGIAAKLACLPLIHTAHTPSDYAVGRWGMIERVLSWFTDQVTSVSKSVAEFMIEGEGVARKKVQVILNGVKSEDYDVTVDRAEKRRELGLAENDFAYINVARFFPNKDHSTLLKAFAIVVKQMPEAKLLLCGEGTLKEDLMKEAAALGLTNSVKFLGNRRDIPYVHRAIDVFVLSSIKEGLPIVLLEAMASGVPIVTTDVDGNPEAVLHNETGLVVPARNPEALAKAMIELKNDPARRRSMGEKGRTRVKEHFTFEKMVASYYAIYDRISNL